MTREMYRNMKVTYEKSDETYIKSILLYGHTDSKLYADEKHKDPILTSEFKEIMGANVLIKDATATYVPVRFKESSGVVSAFVKDAASTEKEFKTTANPS